MPLGVLIVAQNFHLSKENDIETDAENFSAKYTLVCKILWSKNTKAI